MYKYAHSFDFTAIKTACSVMPAHLRDIVFLLLFVGFGTKAGIVPLHIWLPYAHPQAPSHISSSVSGVIVRTTLRDHPVYHIHIRGKYFLVGSFGFNFAVISCLVGVIYALMEHDIKRLLAYIAWKISGLYC